MAQLHQYLAFYSIQIKKKYSREYIDFTMLDGSGRDLPNILDTLYNCCRELSQNECKDEKEKSITGVEDLSRDNTKRRVSGMISHGGYGVSGTLYNTANRNKRRIRRTHSPMFKYYFQIYIPKNGNKGILAIHSRGKSGCKTAFDKAARAFLERAVPDLVLVLKPVNINFEDRDEFFDQFSIRKVRVVTYEPKGGLARQVRKGRREIQETVTVERIIKAGRNGNSLFSFPSFAADPVKETKKFFKGYIQLPEQATNRQVEVTIDMDGLEKTIKLENDAMDFHASIDLTGELPLEEQADPSYEALDEACTPLVNHAIENIIGD